MSEPITVLIVDNDRNFAELAATMLENERGCLAVETATSAGTALETLDDFPVDCVVSDYEMPGLSGLELLEAVRERDPDLPFILFTGKGSEEVASEAISAGVTQYLRKKPGRDRYTLLANQITNAVSQYRAETELRESERRYERTVAALHETTRELMRAGTKREMYRIAVETAGDVLGVPIVSAYAFDPDGGRLEHAVSTDTTRSLLDPAVTFERGEGLAWEAFSTGEAAYSPDVRCGENVYNTETLRRSELLVPLGTHGILIAGSEEIDAFDETTVELVHALAANTEAALDRAERERRLREHDRTLTRQNEELTRLNTTNEIVRGINRGVARASTRREIETAVCERLADTDRYRFAVIASNDDGTPSPTAWAGIDTAYVDRISEDGATAPEARLARRALEEKRVRAVGNVLDDEEWESRRTEALTYGYQTVLGVPLVDADRRYGTLLVYADRADAVSERERELLGELGETIGHAVRSAERTRAMLTDSRLELELDCPDSRLLVNRISAALEEPVTLEGLIERDGESVVLFFSTMAPAIDALEEAAGRWETIETLSIVSQTEEMTLFKVTGASTPFIDVLREYDARLGTARSTDDGTAVVVTVPRRVEARSVVESLQTPYPGTTLTARRETTSTPVMHRFDAVLKDRLTAKQYEALQAAHYGGFFEWPRESTGEQLAAALDVSAPTYHYHLRAAQRKVVARAFDGEFT